MSKVYDQREETMHFAGSSREERERKMQLRVARVFTVEQFKFLSDFADRQIELQRYRGAERPAGMHAGKPGA